MDNLFRRAAEGYPLNTGSADWDKLHAMLGKQDEPVFPKNRRQFWVLLLLVAPLMFICNRLSDAFPPLSKTTPAHKISLVVSQTAPSENAADLSSRLSRTKSNKDGTRLVADKQQYRNYNPVAVKKIGNKLAVQHNPSLLATITSSADRKIERATFSEQAAESTHQTLTELKEDTSINAGEIFSASDGNRLEEAEADSLEKAEGAPTETEINKDPEQKPKPRRKKFFISLVAGPDITTVKFQQWSNVGLQAGVLVGYQLSNRFAVEAGVLSGRKYYKSDGEYFDQSKLYLPPNTEMIALTGNCRMLELPVTLRYSFNDGKKKTFFTSAGFSSYLMQSEDYQYRYLYRSSGNVATHRKVYKDQSRNWFSVVQLSGGVFAPLGKIGHLRIEPYYALPVGGIGYGNLPLSSLGLRLGITSQRF